jgi:hypothetical protein
MDQVAVADQLLAASSPADHRPFLLGRVVTDQLRAAPVDTSLPHWQRYLADSIEAAFDVDLARVTPPGSGLPSGIAAPGLGRTMLAALTWAFGAGFPEEEWLAVASRLAGQELGREHVSWVLDELGRYVVQDGEGGVAVYRVAHQSLADHLRPPYRRTGERPFDPAAGPVWQALAARYAALLAAGFPATAPRRPDLAYAALEVADVASSWGRWRDAIAPAEEAVDSCRALAADNPAFLPDLAHALINLGNRLGELGLRADALPPAQEAVEIWTVPDLVDIRS